MALEVFLKSAYLLLKLKEMFKRKKIEGHRTHLRNKLD